MPAAMGHSPIVGDSRLGRRFVLRGGALELLLLLLLLLPLLLLLLLLRQLPQLLLLSRRTACAPPASTSSGLGSSSDRGTALGTGAAARWRTCAGRALLLLPHAVPQPTDAPTSRGGTLCSSPGPQHALQPLHPLACLPVGRLQLERCLQVVCSFLQLPQRLPRAAPPQKRLYVAGLGLRGAAGGGRRQCCYDTVTVTVTCLH
jgi:hypothetical protein